MSEIPPATVRIFLLPSQPTTNIREGSRSRSYRTTIDREKTLDKVRETEVVAKANMLLLYCVSAICLRIPAERRRHCYHNNTGHARMGGKTPQGHDASLLHVSGFPSVVDFRWRNLVTIF